MKSLSAMAALAEGRVDSTKHPQYRGHWSGDEWVRVRIKRNVTTKMGRAFDKGEVTIGRVSDLDDGDDREFFTCFSWKNSMDTLLLAKDVEILV